MLGRLKSKIIQNIIKKEGGEKTSLCARKLAKKNNVVIGMHTYGGCFADSFNIGGSVIIGRYCSFASDVHYFGANHPAAYASMSPYFYRKEWGYDVVDVKRAKLLVGNDVWVGYGTLITSSCASIGNGALIAAGSVVTKDVPSYAIVMGVPAEVKGYRFPVEIRNKLDESRWWEKEPEELMQFYELISDPEKWANEIINHNNT